ncbi:MAG: hypothetical protein Kow00124_25270 [Anaerolineae bacterium]
MSEDHFQRIYRAHAAEYDLMVRREDYQGNLPRALDAICPPDGLDVVEMGAGTGRLTRLIAPRARSVIATDAEPHMLETAAASLAAMGLRNVRLITARNDALPLPAACADLAIEGWSFGHFNFGPAAEWRAAVEPAIAEMQRVLRPGGTAVLIETLGTGVETPHPPTPELAAFYAYLEGERGFRHRWVRTDYRFESVEEAERLTRFFFLDDLADRVKREGLVILPECTGIWWRTF